MTGISSISSSLLQSYTNYQSKSELSTKEMFQMLSLEMGGDSETITKDQLDAYISDAQDGTTDVSDTELSALETLQKNWDNISGGKNSITYSDMGEYTTLLLATVSTPTLSDSSSFASPTDEVYGYLMDSLGLSSSNDITESDLSSYLTELLSANSSDNGSTSDLVDTLTNLLATYSSNSTIELDA